MIAMELLDCARRSGLKLSLQGDHLRVEPRRLLAADLRSALVARKPELLALLAAEQAEAAEERRAIQAADGIFIDEPAKPAIAGVWTMAEAVTAVLATFQGATIELTTPTPQKEISRAA